MTTGVLRFVVLAGLGLGLAAAVDRATCRPSGPVRLEVGAFSGPLLDGLWSPPQRGAYPEDVDPSEVGDGVLRFYYRRFQERAEMDLPLQSRSDRVGLVLRADGGVRSVLRLYAGGRPAGELLIPPGPWQRHRATVDLPPGEPLTLGLALRAAPLVRGDHAEELGLAVDYLEVESPQGFQLAVSARVALALAPVLALAFAVSIGMGTAAATGTAAAVAAAVALAARLDPIQTSLAVPRLLPLSLAAGLIAWAVLSRESSLLDAQRRVLALVVAGGTLFHGSVVFFPNHNPPDLDTHAVRTLDLDGTPWSYGALLRYGSHLPTRSQEAAPATDLFGERALVPYSPLPYGLYYALYRLGFDVGWIMTVATAALMMLVAPLVWLVARHVWGLHAAWTAALLFALDLPVWHHLGRAHLPASAGNALGVAALLALVLKGSRLESPRSVAVTGSVLAAGTLGYTSLALLIGLFGLILFILLVVDARAIPNSARRALFGAFVLGGLLAGVLYYFHYAPGLLRQAGALETAAPDLFDPRTFLVFHNESRQSMRIWILGSWWLVAGGLLSAPVALVRARPDSRPLLLAWLMTWAVFMVLKEPFLFPKLLRWTKEEQFLSPLMDLMVAGLVSTPPRRWMRWAVGGVAVAWALRLQLRDFLLHANSLAL